MHYYQFNIGDYASHTRHLEPIEDLIYRRLLDLYYLHERPLSQDATAVAKQIGLRDMAEQVHDILSEFFDRTPDGYRSARADREIAHYHSKIEQASRAGKASAERRFNARSTDVQPTNNQEPITNKQETSKEKESRKRSPPVPKPEDVDQQTWDDWLALRKAKKAPVTQTVLNQAKSEASKAGMTLDDFLTVWCARGSQGLQADWLKPHEKAQSQALSFAQQDELARRARWKEMTGEDWPSNDGAMDYIDVDTVRIAP